MRIQPAEPEYPVLWCNWGGALDEWNRKPWGEFIDITGD